MVVIFAGNECSGKSTCFENLKGKMDKFVFIKESYTPSIEHRIARVDSIEKMQCLHQDAIFDRATIVDDNIYSVVMEEGESVLPILERYEEVLNKCVIIYFDCALEVVEERIRKRGDEYIKPYQLKQIAEEYEKFFSKYHEAKVRRIDVSTLTPEEVAKKVKELIENEKRNESC